MSKLIAFVADSHFSERNRFNECREVHAWIAADAAAQGAQVLLHAGDLYDAKSTPTERAAAADFVQLAADHMPVLIVRGNHDALGDLPILERLSASHPITVCEQSEERIFDGLQVLCLPWPRKTELVRRIAEQAGQWPTQAESSAAAAEALRAILGGFSVRVREARESGIPSVLLAHAQLGGSVTSTGQVLVGCDMELSVHDLAEVGADAVLLGHIHRHQFLAENIWYAGSPRRCNFGEPEPKGYWLVELERDGYAQQIYRTFRETPCRNMISVHMAHSPELGIIDPGVCELLDPESTFGSVAGAEIRLRYDVEEANREVAAQLAAAEVARLENAGAHSVKLEEVVRPARRARESTITTARTTLEKVTAWAASRGESVPEGIGAELAQLEEEARQ